MRIDDLHHGELLELDDRSGVIRFAGRRALLLDAVALGILREYLVDNFGRAAARVVLTQFGFAHGWRMAEAMREAFQWANSEEWRGAGARIHALGGLFCAQPGCEDVLAETGATVLASYEAEQHLLHFGRSDSPVCWTICGLMSGYTSYTTGMEIYVIEGAHQQVCVFHPRGPLWGHGPGPGGLGRFGQHQTAERRCGGVDAKVSDLVSVFHWEQGREAGDEGHGLEQQAGHAAARPLEMHCDTAVHGALDAALGERWTTEITKQSLELLGVVGPHGGGCMDRESLMLPEQVGPTRARGGGPGWDPDSCGRLLGASGQEQVIRGGVGMTHCELLDPARDGLGERITERPWLTVALRHVRVYAGTRLVAPSLEPRALVRIEPPESAAPTESEGNMPPLSISLHNVSGEVRPDDHVLLAWSHKDGVEFLSRTIRVEYLAGLFMAGDPDDAALSADTRLIVPPGDDGLTQVSSEPDESALLSIQGRSVEMLPSGKTPRDMKRQFRVGDLLFRPPPLKAGEPVAWSVVAPPRYRPGSADPVAASGHDRNNGWWGFETELLGTAVVTMEEIDRLQSLGPDELANLNVGDNLILIQAGHLKPANLGLEYLLIGLSDRARVSKEKPAAVVPVDPVPWLHTCYVRGALPAKIGAPHVVEVDPPILSPPPLGRVHVYRRSPGLARVWSVDEAQ